MHVQRSERSRHLVVRLTAGDLLPQALVAALRDEQVGGGWLRAGGIVTDVELRAFDPARGQPGESRHLAGPVHVLSIESSVGTADGEPSLSLRAVLARETDRGLETIAGEIASARVVAVEALVTVFDDLGLARAMDAAGIALVDPGAASPTAGARPPKNPGQPPPARAQASSTASAWSAAASASGTIDREGPRPGHAASSASSHATPTGGNSGNSMSSQATSTHMPQRPARPAETAEQPIPQPGDVVDHFAFGRCEVVKTDGERLHLRIPRDGRIREIALEMLRVTPLEPEGGIQRFKLERRI